MNFIDDKNFNRVIDILKRDGWTNVSRIKDVEALEQQEIRDSHVLFVDIQGVGKKMGFADEGLGLIVALREKYKYKKIIVYSAEEPQKIKAFHKGMNDADYRLAKDTDPYEFERLLEIYAMECFSVEQCVERLYKIICKELGYAVDREKLTIALANVYNTKNFENKNLSKLFQISNVSLILDIIKIFCSIP